MTKLTPEGIDARRSIVVANMSMAKASGQPMFATYAHMTQCEDDEDYFVMAVNGEGKLILFVPNFHTCLISMTRFAMDFDKQEMAESTGYFHSEPDYFGTMVDNFEAELQDWALGEENRWTF